LIGQLKELSKYDDDRIWAAIQQKNQGTGDEVEDPDDLKSPEWKVFSNPSNAKASSTFKLRIVEPPTDFTKYFEKMYPLMNRRHTIVANRRWARRWRRCSSAARDSCWQGSSTLGGCVCAQRSGNSSRRAD
jgi:hypothetical protein